MKKRTSDIAFDYIKDKIFKGEWSSGEKISSEKELEEEIGVGRSSIRAAVDKLVALNILEKKPGDGTYVKELDSESLLKTFLPLIAFSEGSYYEIIECRMQLDILAIGLFIENMKSEQIEELNEIHERMSKATNDINEFFELDMKFHKLIAKHSQNKTLYLINSILYNILKEFFIEQYKTVPLEKKVQDHEKLLEAIKRRDKELAISYERCNFLETMAKLKIK
ncbi:MAG: GntR family transcriptional regulator, transcriptional repressor for pyruvate dehydrogenase complex [Fusobacteriaceae bacterium]|jgi:DNA-binding FadR family transcriptional regulator|nr:GntR domain protein [Fusobacteriales bacterium]MDN5303599.1 GntR family transcriptional regulator, transcriptional repressor for pyruvate dehydrogenase complex [Fusobacteriaceae bacterium]